MEALQTKLFKRLEEKEAEMIRIRRHFHENPELSFQETKTAQYIADFYEGKDCTVQTKFGGGNGILVTIKGGNEGPTLAIRADFDALPIQEECDLPFASKVPGVMHACGHDAHTAYMMILADTLIELKDELPGTIRIIHQPAEEVPPGGAKGMVEAGCLEGVDHVFGIHVISTVETGTVAYCKGSVHTGRSTFKLTMQGKGGHGSTPQEANDTIVAAAQFVTAVQTIVSRRVNPFESATVTIGSFDGKGSANVIKDTVTLEGDVRIMKEDTRYLVEKEFKQILSGICAAYGITYDLDYTHDYPVVVNDINTTEMVAQAVTNAQIPGVEVVECGPQNPSEDFAYYAQERPSCFFFVGARPAGLKETFPHHHPKVIFDEASMLIAGKSMASAVLHYLFKGV